MITKDVQMGEGGLEWGGRKGVERRTLLSPKAANVEGPWPSY